MTRAAVHMAGRSAHELAALVAAGTVSAREVVDAHIARIEQVDGLLNALVDRRFAVARVEADEADAAVARGRPLGPLHGVPVTVKESLDLAGTASTFGLPGRREPVDVDDPYVARLRGAGAIVLGTTNVAPPTPPRSTPPTARPSTATSRPRSPSRAGSTRSSTASAAAPPNSPTRPRWPTSTSTAS